MKQNTQSRRLFTTSRLTILPHGPGRLRAAARLGLPVDRKLVDPLAGRTVERISNLAIIEGGSYRPLLMLNPYGDLERYLLRAGQVHSAEDWRLVLEPVIARYRERGADLYFHARAAFAKPEIYELLEHEGIGYAIRLPANQVLQRRIGHLLTRPVGRPPRKPIVTFPASATKRRAGPDRVGWWPGRMAPRGVVPAGRLHRLQRGPVPG